MYILYPAPSFKYHYFLNDIYRFLSKFFLPSRKIQFTELDVVKQLIFLKCYLLSVWKASP